MKSATRGRSVGRSLPPPRIRACRGALVVAVIGSLGALDHAEATVPGEVLPTE
jgi:hypothetical protein